MIDPTRKDLMKVALDYLRGMEGERVDFDIEEAIYWFSNDYHTGQRSNLYSVLSTSPYNPGAIQSGCQSELSRELYHVYKKEFSK